MERTKKWKIELNETKSLQSGNQACLTLRHLAGRRGEKTNIRNDDLSSYVSISTVSK